jgi:DNA-binding response OmpR family regulator
MNPSQKTILIIEDHDDIRESTAEILELAGYTVFTAPEGKTGVEMALEHLPDLVLCDIMMPVMDGYGVLYLLGKNAKTASIPLIFITAKAERADLRKGMEMGADDYITKPFDDMELLNAIESRLKKVSIGSNSTANSLNSDEQEVLFKKLIESGRERLYKKKQLVYQEGDTPVYLYQIIKGNVRNYLFHKDGRELTTVVLRAGDFFGYESVLMKKPYTDNAEALEETELRLINKEDFYELLERNPGLNQRFIRLLSRNIIKKDEQMLGFAYHSVRKRIANALVSVAEKLKTNATDDTCVIRVSREDLASIAGTANETISRTLADFIDEGLLSKQGNSIEVHSIEKLKEVKQ